MAPYSSPDDATCYALVPCAGSGVRAGAEGPKQYVAVAGSCVVAHTLAALQAVPRIAATLVVLSAGDRQFEHAAPRHRGDRAWVERCGGATRAATVAAGLAALAARGARQHDWVLVHDAARCLVRAEWIDRLIDGCVGDDVGGLLALPVADTLKEEGAGRVAATLDRHGKWAAQTPQMFRLGVLRGALARAGDDVTDESTAIEAIGLRPRLVRGELENFKLTWPGDFVLAERLLACRAGAGDEIRAFVPARDFERSLAFYRDLGFTLAYRGDDVALLRQGAMAFLLQNFYEPAHASNFMMQMFVDDLDGWAARCAAVAQAHGASATAAELRPWGLRELTLHDPSGVLWRIAQRPTKPSKEIS